MLDVLEVQEEARLDCNARILCITSTSDKVFKDIESSFGVHQLIGDGALSKWNSKNSIWYLDLNAFAKLLSPSNAQETISLYKEYKSFLRDLSTSAQGKDLAEVARNLDSKVFLGFDSNRRLTDLSTLSSNTCRLVVNSMNNGQRWEPKQTPSRLLFVS